MSLPYDCKVEWLETRANGVANTCYIDTGIIPSPTIRWELCFLCWYDKTYNVYNGVNTYGRRIRAIGHAGKENQYNADLGRRGCSRIVEPNVPHTCIVDAFNNKSSVDGYVSNFGSDTTGAATLSGSNETILVFGCHENGKLSQARQQRIWYSKIWDSNELIQSLIPVRKGTTGYMYDEVSGQLMTKLGSGKFYCGPDIIIPFPGGGGYVGSPNRMYPMGGTMNEPSV